MERRFARIQVAEPTPEEAEEILKGLRSRYEKHHGVEITDEALHAAVQLSIRYLNDRQLPDKAIDLMDESAAKVRLDKADQPSEINELRTEISQLITEKKRPFKTNHLKVLLGFVKRKTSDGKLEELIAVKEKSVWLQYTSNRRRRGWGCFTMDRRSFAAAREERKRTIDGIRNHFTSTGRWPK